MTTLIVLFLVEYNQSKMTEPDASEPQTSFRRIKKKPKTLRQAEEVKVKKEDVEQNDGEETDEETR